MRGTISCPDWAMLVTVSSAPSDLYTQVEDYDDTAGVHRINELKREISKLGYVNVNAIEESKVLSERYEELTVQMDDLLKAEADILAIIKDLATQLTEKFDDAFPKINANFSKIFRELFGGGNARLVLTTDDILTAGVDIFAEPPGKSLGGNLSLLSGGEKSLTAIAIGTVTDFGAIEVIISRSMPNISAIPTTKPIPTIQPASVAPTTGRVAFLSLSTCSSIR